jgi:pimeloyl-ACP methyl ester carboxylesterase
MSTVRQHFFAPALCAANLALLAWAATTHAQSVETGTVKLADSNIEYFSRGTGEGIVLLPGGTLTVGYLDGLADALAKAGYRVVGINFRGSGKSTGSSDDGERCGGRGQDPEAGSRSHGRK